jgi:hypothetical protein
MTLILKKILTLFCGDASGEGIFPAGKEARKFSMNFTEVPYH